ncbi:MAG: hypothetical protein ACTSP4_02435 [Candidatus Hodarchaeales archaeon]
MTELFRVAFRSYIEQLSGNRFLQPVYDIIKIFLKKDKLNITVKIAVMLKAFIMLILLAFLPVLFSYPVFEPRYSYMLIILLLLVIPVLDLLIDRMSYDEKNLFSWVDYSRSNLFLIAIFTLSILGKIILEYVYDPSFPDSAGFPVYFSVDIALLGIVHFSFALVSVLAISLYNYRLDSVRRLNFTSAPGIPANWPVSFTGKYLALDMAASIMLRFSMLMLVIHFFVSPFNGFSMQLSIASIGIGGMFTGMVINFIAFAGLAIFISLVNSRVFRNKGLRERERFTIRVLLPVHIITYLSLVFIPILMQIITLLLSILGNE